MSITKNELNVVSNLTNLISKSRFVQQPVSEKLSKSLLRSSIENSIHLLVFQHLVLAKLGFKKGKKSVKSVAGQALHALWSPLQRTQAPANANNQPPPSAASLCNKWTAQGRGYNPPRRGKKAKAMGHVGLIVEESVGPSDR